MSQEEFLSALDTDMVERFKRAIEVGKWPDGKAITDEQRQTCMQAVIWFEHKNLPEEQRTGYVPPKETLCDTPHDTETIKWK